MKKNSSIVPDATRVCFQRGAHAPKSPASVTAPAAAGALQKAGLKVSMLQRLQKARHHGITKHLEALKLQTLKHRTDINSRARHFRASAIKVQ
jgi:hypothetical protein